MHHQNTDAAETKIQSAFRGHQTRKIVDEQNAAAIKIQSQLREHVPHGNLLHTLCTTNPKFHYTPKEIFNFEQNEQRDIAEKIKSKQEQTLQLQQQEESAMIIQETFCGHSNRSKIANKKKSKKSIKTYRRVCKMKAKDIKSLRVSGYSNKRLSAVNELSEEYKQKKD